MAKIQGNGRPTQFTKGAKGDVYTDLNTGKRYECLGSDGFVGRGQSNELVKYDWIMLKELGVISGGGSDTPSGGGVSSWNDLTDKPFSTESTEFIGFENKTVEITQMEHDVSGYMYYIGLVEGSLGELGTTTGSGMEDTCNFNVENGDRVVIVFDGVKYESKVRVFANYLWLGKAELTTYRNNMPGYMTGENIPVGICGTENGFIIGVEEDYVGTHEISLYVYDDVVTPLEEKYIPETVATKEYVLKNLSLKRWETDDTTPVIPAGETVMPDQFTKWGSSEPPILIVCGEYTDGDGMRHLIPLKWVVDGSFVKIMLDEALEYDVYPVVYSTVRVSKYYPM